MLFLYRLIKLLVSCAASGFWETTDMSAGEDREILVRTSLRELGIYILFLTVLCIGNRREKRRNQTKIETSIIAFFSFFPYTL